MILNTIVLVIASKQSTWPETRSRTNVHYLVFHLTIADTITCFITMPMETLWRLTLQWYAGNIMCKVLMMIRTGGYILSSLMLVVISIDRCLIFLIPYWMIFIISAGTSASVSPSPPSTLPNRGTGQGR
jgi:hypothetical protein